MVVDLVTVINKLNILEMRENDAHAALLVLQVLAYTKLFSMELYLARGSSSKDGALTQNRI
jgi:hypothetical protein